MKNMTSEIIIFMKIFKINVIYSTDLIITFDNISNDFETYKYKRFHMYYIYFTVYYYKVIKLVCLLSNNFLALSHWLFSSSVFTIYYSDPI